MVTSMTHRHGVAVSNGDDTVTITGGHLSLELLDVGPCPDLGRADHNIVVVVAIATLLLVVLLLLAIVLLRRIVLIKRLLGVQFAQLQAVHGVGQLGTAIVVVTGGIIPLRLTDLLLHTLVMAVILVLVLQVELLHILMVVFALQLVDKHSLLLWIARELFLGIQLKVE